MKKGFQHDHVPKRLAADLAIAPQHATVTLEISTQGLQYGCVQRKIIARGVLITQSGFWLMNTLAYRIFTVCCHTIAACYLLIALLWLYQVEYTYRPSQREFTPLNGFDSP